MKSLIESSRKSSIYVACAQVICRFSGMLATVVLARKLTIEDYGVYNLFFGAITVFSFFTNFGLAGTLQRFLPEYARQGKNGFFFRTFFFSIGFRSVIGLIVFGLAMLLFGRLAGYFDISTYRYEFILFCIGTYALFQIDFLQLALNSLFLHGYSSLGQLAYQVLRVLLFIVLLVFLGGGLTEVFAGELIAYGLGAVIFWALFISKAYVPKKNIHRSEKKVEWKRLLRFSAYNATTIPGSFLFSHAMDYFVVAAMATTTQLGIYALGSRASNMLISIMPQNLLQTVIRPAFYHNYYAVEEKSLELNRMFRTLVVLIAAVLIPVLALVGVQAESILIFVFKSKFVEATPIFIMLLSFNVFKIIELPSDLVLQAIEKVQARFYAQIFALYNIVAAVLLMPRYGLIGVAFATGSALMGKCLFWFFMAHYYTGISICWKALLKITANTAVAVVVSYWISCLGDTPLWMFASLMAGSTVYLILSYLNQFFDNREKELINRFCKRQVFKCCS